MGKEIHCRIELRPYSDADQQRLVEILRMNVPKYFCDNDVLDFEQYLHDKMWDRHWVFLDRNRLVIGCASCYWRAPSVVGLSWMFFEPFRVGSRAIRPWMEEYFSIIVHDLCSDGNVTLALNTIPRVAKFMHRFGFNAVETIKDGYGPGYDKVYMERKMNVS